MEIIKEWYGKGGAINGRFYKSGGAFYIDYCGCKETEHISLFFNGCSLVRVFISDNVPKLYRRYILNWFSSKYQQ